MSTRSTSSNLFSPLRDPESLIRRRNLGEPSSLFDFEEVMNIPHNNMGPPPLPNNGPPPVVRPNGPSSLPLLIYGGVVQQEEYDIWAMEMEHYLEYIDNDVWKVIQNGNSKKRIAQMDKISMFRILLTPIYDCKIHAVKRKVA
ncbi:hypothetical protein Tco_0978899 [Tanacetum coccineum]|uniref:Uncharacterized protein n=1 Tax=Tanacetum coccineum TaxID=301880 RepID=A0ABQ5EPE3_9ASTR